MNDSKSTLFARTDNEEGSMIIDLLVAVGVLLSWIFLLSDFMCEFFYNYGRTFLKLIATIFGFTFIATVTLILTVSTEFAYKKIWHLFCSLSFIIISLYISFVILANMCTLNGMSKKQKGPNKRRSVYKFLHVLVLFINVILVQLFGLICIKSLEQKIEKYQFFRCLILLSTIYAINGGLYFGVLYLKGKVETKCRIEEEDITDFEMITQSARTIFSNRGERLSFVEKLVSPVVALVRLCKNIYNTFTNRQSFENYLATVIAIPKYIFYMSKYLEIVTTIKDEESSQAVEETITILSEDSNKYFSFRLKYYSLQVMSTYCIFIICINLNLTYEITQIFKMFFIIIVSILTQSVFSIVDFKDCKITSRELVCRNGELIWEEAEFSEVDSNDEKSNEENDLKKENSSEEIDSNEEENSETNESTEEENVKEDDSEDEGFCKLHYNFEDTKSD